MFHSIFQIQNYIPLYEKRNISKFDEFGVDQGKLWKIVDDLTNSLVDSLKNI